MNITLGVSTGQNFTEMRRIPMSRRLNSTPPQGPARSPSTGMLAQDPRTDEDAVVVVGTENLAERLARGAGISSPGFGDVKPPWPTCQNVSPPTPDLAGAIEIKDDPDGHDQPAGPSRFPRSRGPRSRSRARADDLDSDSEGLASKRPRTSLREQHLPPTYLFLGAEGAA